MEEKEASHFYSQWRWVGQDQKKAERVKVWAYGLPAPLMTRL